MGVEFFEEQVLDISGAVTVFDFENSGSLGRGESSVIGVSIFLRAPYPSGYPTKIIYRDKIKRQKIK